MAQLSKKEWLTKLIAAAKEVGNANPWALGFVAYDDLRAKMQGPLKVSGQQWYATHQNDPMGMNDPLAVPDDADLKVFVKMYSTTSYLPAENISGSYRLKLWPMF